MGYSPTADPPSGEICIRGPAVFKGYYNQPELTAEAIGEAAQCMQAHTPSAPCGLWLLPFVTAQLPGH
jgi:acyl-CoA synthetase (AMP-forming)/AMP-acid ligase II